MQNLTKMRISEFDVELEEMSLHTLRSGARSCRDFKGIKVDKVKIEVIEKFEFPIDVKDMRSFLGHYRFY
jgi:hypothetical protein